MCLCHVEVCLQMEEWNECMVTPEIQSEGEAVCRTEKKGWVCTREGESYERMGDHLSGEIWVLK